MKTKQGNFNKNLLIDDSSNYRERENNEKLLQYEQNLEQLKYLKSIIERNPGDYILKIAAVMLLQTTKSLAQSFSDDLREKIFVTKRDGNEKIVAKTSNKSSDSSSKFYEQNFSGQRAYLAHSQDFSEPADNISNLIEHIIVI